MYYNHNDKPSDSRRWYNYGEEGEKCEIKKDGRKNDGRKLQKAK